MKNKVEFHLPEEGYKGEIRVRGFVSILDEPQEAGGTNAGPNPVENLLGSLAGCIALTLRMYAKRKEWDTGEIKVEVFQEESEHHQMEIHKRISFGKEGTLSKDQLKKLYEISEKCPVSKLIQSPIAVIIDNE